jgi:hypothetical protein
MYIMFCSNYQVLLQLILTRKQNEQSNVQEKPRPKMLELYGDEDASAEGTSESVHPSIPSVPSWSVDSEGAEKTVE